jgi:hypothetical protein
MITFSNCQKQISPNLLKFLLGSALTLSTPKCSREGKYCYDLTFTGGHEGVFIGVVVFYDVSDNLNQAGVWAAKWVRLENENHH